MSATLESTTSSSTPPADKTQRDLQRGALADLVTLCSQCQLLETEIDQKHTSAIEQTHRALKNQLTELASQYRQQEEQVKQKYQQRVEAILIKHKADRSSLKEADAAARQRVMLESDTREGGLKKKLEDAVWMSESLYDGTARQVEVDFAKAKELIDAHFEVLDKVDRDGDALLDKFGMKFVVGYETTKAPEPVKETLDEHFKQAETQLEQQARSLRSPRLPWLFVGATPYFLVTLLAALGAATTGFLVGFAPIPWGPMGIAAAVAAAVSVGLGFALRVAARNTMRVRYTDFKRAVHEAKRLGRAQGDWIAEDRDAKAASAEKRKDVESQRAKLKWEPELKLAIKRREKELKTLLDDLAAKDVASTQARSAGQLDADQRRDRAAGDVTQRRATDEDAANNRHKDAMAKIEADYNAARAELLARWEEGLQAIQRPIHEGDSENAKAALPWTDPAWTSWKPPKKFTETIRFGELQVDLQKITDQAPKSLKLPASFKVPALLAFPRQASLLIQHDRTGRQLAIDTLRALMSRLLTSLPAGRVRFTIIDPVALGQNFAGFMHLADYDENLVGARIWTDAEHIEQRLVNLTEHMETVIQKYLRNEFETIDDYNAQAGELAEPYRFLVISDFPTNFSDESVRRLNSIASTGARCGVYTLIARDLRANLPANTHIDEVVAYSVNLMQQKDGTLIWNDDVFKVFPLSLDVPPSESQLTELLHKVGVGAKEASRVEVNFSTIAPPIEKLWSMDSSSELRVPVGRMGATRHQYLRLGKGVAQHTLIAGKTGSGKSTLLNAIITNSAMWYSPDEVHLYLIDFKKGVEFKTYATHNLPHARAVAVESDREFGLSVLQRLDGELTNRGEMFRKTGAQDLPSYRQTTGQKMARILLIIDEFQEFFSEDDRLGQDAALLLDRLVRQGRAFGIHVLLGSQTIGGTSGLSRSTIGQMGVRIALQTSEADSQLILGDGNSAARLLSRPGEAIYNDAGGLVEANSPFQVAWLPDEGRELFLGRVNKKVEETNFQFEPPIVFEGNAPAEIKKNRKLMELLTSSAWPVRQNAPLAYLGEPVAIKDPTSVAMRRQSGANILVIGQQEESALAILTSSALSLAAQHAPQQAVFYLLDGSAADSILAGRLNKLKEAIPHETNVVDFRAVDEAIATLHAEMQKRRDSDQQDFPGIFVLIYGMQRYRVLRKTEESFGGFSTSDEEKKVPPDKLFNEMLREGPSFGIHFIAWIDTAANIDRTLDRAAMREFDNRILFQMSANDSSTLIDAPTANKLGFFRALAYSEEQGVIEKFRPYGLANDAWLEEVRSMLAAKH